MVIKNKFFIFFFLLSTFFFLGTVFAEISPLPAVPPIPPGNSMSRFKIKLGKKLFFEPRLSKSNWISCATCHNPAMAFTDRIPQALGHGMKKGPRNTPTVLNAAFLKVQFWDGRVETLEEQALGPIQASVEMNSDLSNVVAKLNAIPTYVKMFKMAFPGEESTITKEKLAKAIAAYERTLVTPNAPIDRYLNGDTKSLSRDAVAGFKKFESLGCSDCHSGAMLSDSELHVIRLPGAKDKGLYETTHKNDDMYKFRTPTLRNVNLTWPYMHDGSIKTLNQAVELMGKIALDKDLDEASVKEIVEFLKSLTGQKNKNSFPQLP